MDVNSKLLTNRGELLEDPGTYRRLVEKLNYLTMTRSGTIFVVSIVSQFLSASRTIYLEAVMRILRY